jgi:hypothetical protein
MGFGYFADFADGYYTTIDRQKGKRVKLRTPKRYINIEINLY